MELKDLPNVDSLAVELEESMSCPLPRPILVAISQGAISTARDQILNGSVSDPFQIASQAIAPLAKARPRCVINATGVLLHTNLGRAPLASNAATAGTEVAIGYSNLEFDLAAGTRGGRGRYLNNLLNTLTGADDALVVNNNAGALLLSLAATCKGGGVLVSRGELVEIGGSFRLPELMAASGAKLIEVGTTNRTRLEDYATRVAEATAILKVHPSNYRLEGYTEDVGYPQLAELAATHHIPFIADVGSGLLDNRIPWLPGTPPLWLANEPAVRQTLALGADLVLFSGDKLLGGPQAGVVVGDADLIGNLRSHPLARALRIDGVTQTAMVATLEHYAAGNATEIPFWRMATTPSAEIRTRSETVATDVGPRARVIDSHSIPGAGAVPGKVIPSPALSICGKTDEQWAALLCANPPILGRRQRGTLELDLRTVDPAHDSYLTESLQSLLAE